MDLEVLYDLWVLTSPEPSFPSGGSDFAFFSSSRLRTGSLVQKIRFVTDRAVPCTIELSAMQAQT
jgi:hypothetical protein